MRRILKNTFSPYWEKVKPILEDIKHFLLNKCTFQHLLFHSTNTIKGMKMTTTNQNSNIPLWMYGIEAVLLAILLPAW